MKAKRTILKTDRLTLREFTTEDLEDLYRIFGDREVMRYITGAPRPRGQTRERLRKYLADYNQKGFGLWAAELGSTGRLIGRCGIERREENGQVLGDLALLFEARYQRQGLGTECGRALLEYGFKELGLECIIGRMHPENKPSIRTVEKLEMRFDGWAAPNRLRYFLNRPTRRDH